MGPESQEKKWMGNFTNKKGNLVWRLGCKCVTVTIPHIYKELQRVIINLSYYYNIILILLCSLKSMISEVKKLFK